MIKNIENGTRNTENFPTIFATTASSGVFVYACICDRSSLICIACARNIRYYTSLISTTYFLLVTG
jgi:hypothetical protein